MKCFSGITCAVTLHLQTLIFHPGKSSIAKILANYAVRFDQKPVCFIHSPSHCTSLTHNQLLVDLDCAGGLSNVPGSIGVASMARVIPPVSSGVSQPWHRAQLAFYVAHEKPDTNPDAFLNAVTYVANHFFQNCFCF